MITNSKFAKSNTREIHLKPRYERIGKSCVKQITSLCKLTERKLERDLRKGSEETVNMGFSASNNYNKFKRYSTKEIVSN